MKIIEKFTLTGQYTPKLFFDAYRTSMSMELKNYSILVYNMFRTAQISFPEEQKMELRMQSSVLAKSREEELVSYIEKVFCERCPFSLIVEPEYVEASESKVRKNSEIRIMQEAAHVIEQSSFGQQQEEPDQFLEEGAGTASEALKEEEKKDASAGKAPAEEKKVQKARRRKKERTERAGKALERATAVSAITSAASSVRTILMYSTAGTLTMRRSLWKVSRQRWVRSASAVRS